MGIKFLGIDSDAERIKTYAIIFTERNIGTDRIDTMSEGVILLPSKQPANRLLLHYYAKKSR